MDMAFGRGTCRPIAGMRAPLVVLVYAINRCTSADSLEYVKSAS